MRKTLGLVVVMLGLLNGFVVYLKTRPPASEIRPPSPQANVSQEPLLVQQINQRAKKIQSFMCKDFKLQLWSKGVRVKLVASLFYQKDKNFRMVTKSLLGEEGDFGSNDKMFWFWSKRNNPPALHYAVYEDFYKTRLKTPFDPMFLRETLGLEPIKTNGKVMEDGGKHFVIDKLKNSVGEPILKWTFIDKENKRINGILITNKEGTPVASGEILKYEGELPKQILYQWFEEETSMLIDFEGQQSNVAIDSGWWKLPNITPKIDMGKD